MNYKQFETVIEKLEKVSETSHSLYLLGVDLMEYTNVYHEIITTLLSSVFDKEGKNWIEWYLYERVGFNGKENPATDKNGNPICYDVPSLWEEVKHNLLTNEKNNQ